jgi:hypothetical protein
MPQKVAIPSLSHPEDRQTSAVTEDLKNYTIHEKMMLQTFLA